MSSCAGKVFQTAFNLFSPWAPVHCILAFFIETCLIKLKPDAALLVEDDEADCGNVVGGRVGWAGLLGANLDFFMFFLLLHA